MFLIFYLPFSLCIELFYLEKKIELVPRLSWRNLNKRICKKVTLLFLANMEVSAAWRTFKKLKMGFKVSSDLPHYLIWCEFCLKSTINEGTKKKAFLTFYWSKEKTTNFFGWWASSLLQNFRGGFWFRNNFFSIDWKYPELKQVLSNFI